MKCRFRDVMVQYSRAVGVEAGSGEALIRTRAKGKRSESIFWAMNGLEMEGSEVERIGKDT